jgi:hypothetical protein
MNTTAEIDRLNEYERTKLGAILQEAAYDIVQFGWKAGGADDDQEDAFGSFPRCVWRAAVLRLEQTYPIFESKWRTYSYALNDAITLATDSENLGEVFHKNDGIESNEEGQGWAYGTLITASHIMNPALADSESKTPDTDSTKTDTGSTPNVAIRVLRYLKRFTWVR